MWKDCLSLQMAILIGLWQDDDNNDNNNNSEYGTTHLVHHRWRENPKRYEEELIGRDKSTIPQLSFGF